MERGRETQAAQRAVQGAGRDGGAERGEDAGEKTLAELSAEYGVHPTMISIWKQELARRAAELFERGAKKAEGEQQKTIDELYRQIGQLKVERDFLAGQPALSRLLKGGR